MDFLVMPFSEPISILAADNPDEGLKAG